MPLPYLSYSAFWLFQKDPMEYYKQYFICRVDEATPQMMLGKIFQEAWSDPKYDYVAALKEAGFTSDKARIIKTALENKDTLRLPKKKCEKKYTVQGMGLAYPIMGIFDGEDLDARLQIENKFGRHWNQAMADESKQITWYALVCYIKHGYIPKQVLQSFNSNNGQPKQFWTKRYMFDLDKLVIEINKMVEKVQRGEFE